MSLFPPRRLKLLLSVFLLLLISSAGLSAQSFRLSTWNIETLGSPSGSEWNASLNVLARIDADIVAIQEVASGESSFVPSFASQAGYPHHALSVISGTMSGGLRLAVLSRFPITSATSHSSVSLSGDPLANDISRSLFEVHVAVPGSASDLAVFVVHLKSGSGSTNDFRRAVEIHRLEQAISAFKTANPTAPWALMGDFNEDLGDGPFGWSYNGLSSGLPATFRLGADISFPLLYEPFQTFLSLGGALLDATQEDSTSIYATREASGRRLDYIIASAPVITNNGDEVYNSNRDNGVDDLPLGNWLPKSGSALSSGTSAAAADHYPVFSDLDLGTITTPSSTPVIPGDLVVSEWLADPTVSSDTFGEWVEIRNPTADTIDLNGFVLRDGGSDSATLSGVSIAPRSHFLLGAHTLGIINGGITPDFVWPSGSFSLNNSADTIEIVSPMGVVLDSVSYSSSNLAVVPGNSMERVDPTALPWTTNFALSSSVFGAGNIGTPGGTNDSDSGPLFTSVSVLGSQLPGSTNLITLSGDPGLEGRSYILAAAECATPGLLLGGSGRVIDLCPGGLLLFSATPNNGVFFNFAGTLSQSGDATASFVIPSVPGLQGFSFQVSGVVFDPNALEGIASIVDNETITLN